MMNQEIYELMDRFERSSLTGMKLSVEKAGENLKLEFSKCGVMPGTAGSAGQTGGREAAGSTAAKSAAVSDSGTAQAAAADGGSGSGFFITAPMVGTYYAASDPKQSPFVMPGDRVFQGQTVCLMEAMKMVSEIPAPCDCIIEEILKADGDLAAFGEPLFRYQPC